MNRGPADNATLEPRDVYSDPRTDDVWRHGGHWWSPLARRPHAPAVAIGVAMMILTVVVADVYELPVRDADGLLGTRMAVLLGALLFFFALEIVPRALKAREPGGSFRAAARTVVAQRWNRRRLTVVAIGLVSFYATYLSYRNLKSFLPFLVEQDADMTLLDLERGLFGGVEPTRLLQDLLGTGAAAHILSSAYLFYLAFVPISLGAALILASNPVPGLWWVTALGLNWCLGAASYYLLPAVGPAFADPATIAALPDTGVAALQQALLQHRAEVLSDPYATTQVQSIAAFASLHVSVVFSAALIAQLVRVPRAIRQGLWIFLAVTIVATLYFGWHYLVDDLAGLVVGLLAVVLSAAMTGHWRMLWGRARDFLALDAAVSPFNVPNGLSVARIALIPVLLGVLIAHPDGSILAAALFALASATDVLDGHLARSRSLVTNVGKVLDPLADKLMVGSVLFVLMALDRVAWWAVAIILGREVLVSVLRSRAARRGAEVGARPLGKAKMCLQVLMVLVLLAVPDPSALAVQALVWATVLTTLVSGADAAAHLLRRPALVATR